MRVRIANFVADMKALNPTKPVSAAVVIKETGVGAMPGMSASEVQSYTTSFLQASGLQILMPQDGAGAEAGAPPVSDLPAYFQAAANAVAAVSPQPVLWSTVETFSAVTGVDPAQYPPGNAVRIQQQVNAVRPYVSDYLSYIYGDDMSQQATYYPVEASRLNRDYQSRSRPSSVPNTPALNIASYSSVPAPSPYYPDATGRHLADHTGGGYNNYNFSDWSGYRVEDDGGTLVITADLGFARQITAIRTLSLSMTNSGIFHPSSLSIAVSSNGQSFSSLGNAILPSPATYNFSLGWSELDVSATARYVRYTFTHQQWLFVSELEILGPPQAPPPPGTVSVTISPSTVPPLSAGQTQQFQATVTGSTNQAVTLSVLQGAQYGSITSSGLYTAPATVPQAITVGVQARSVADTTKFAEVSFTVSPDPSSQQMVGPVNPNNGSGSSQLFSFNATPASGSLQWVQTMFSSSLSPTNACLVWFDPSSNVILLSADNSTSSNNTWVQPPALLGTPGTLSNSQCSIDVANSSVQTNGAGVSVNLSITFNSAWSGTLQYIFMAARDSGGNEVDWPIVGTWNVP